MLARWAQWRHVEARITAPPTFSYSKGSSCKNSLTFRGSNHQFKSGLHQLSIVEAGLGDYIDDSGFCKCKTYCCELDWEKTWVDLDCRMLRMTSPKELGLAASWSAMTLIISDKVPQSAAGKGQQDSSTLAVPECITQPSMNKSTRTK